MSANNLFPPARRPLRSRQTRWANAIASRMVQWGMQPNWISLASILFAAGSGAALLGLRTFTGPSMRALLLLIAAAGIQLRLLCNLLDGMVAIEGNRKSKSGEIYNDVPDRISDVLILVPAGYALPVPWGGALGWLAAVLAVTTAYVRMLGGAAGIPQSFVGPMAKQQRMAVLTVALLASLFEVRNWHGWLLQAALWVIIIGSVITIGRRLHRIASELESR
jgi:phosphatidylglycerophosphate synthase